MRPDTRGKIELFFLVLKMSSVILISIIMVALAWLKWTGLLDGYSGPDCRYLMRVMDDGDIQSELIRWVDNDLEQALRDWLSNGYYLGSATGGSPSMQYFREHNFDLTLLGFAPESQSSWSKIGLVVRNTSKPSYPRSSLGAKSGIDFLISTTRSVSFTKIPRVALLVRMPGAKDFGVKVEYLRKVNGRLAVYCEPRD